MHIVEHIAEVRAFVRHQRSLGRRVAFVPTMGNLHAGHIALVEEAKRHAEVVVVSIFVNPLQFGPQEDFASYPRTPDADAEKLIGAGAALLFRPVETEMYPHGREGVTYVEVPGLSDVLCGAFRPGHFRGVATVVNKLFNIVAPDVAVFGEKDFQQLVVIRRMTADLCLPIAIVGLPTLRESDGLAMSSRNGYLSAAERSLAPRLYAQLRWVADGLTAGTKEIATLENEAMHALAEAGFQPEYVSVRRPRDLQPAGPADRTWVILGAARLGRTRLIDNLVV